MNIWKPLAIVSSTAVVALLAFGDGRGGVTQAAADDQPNMVAARDKLKDARASLDKAVPNKGGHRERAIALVDKALKEVNEGIAWANQHSDH